MENEEKVSCELVAVEEVETELIFEPVTGPLGPRKIIRESLVNQIKEAYPFTCRQFQVPYIGKIKKSKHQRVLDDIILAIQQGKYTREDVLSRAGHCLLATSKALSELSASGIIKQSMVNRKRYYEIVAPSDEKRG